MKNLFFLLTLTLGFMYGCTKDEAVNSTLSSPQVKSSTPKIVSKKVDAVKVRQLIDANKVRLANSDALSLRSPAQTINVPGNYATIQGAVDAASPGANIFVNGGTYNETVMVSTAGLNIKAVGNVTLNGGFLLTEGADNVKIQKFHIDITSAGMTTGCGILIFGGVSGCQIIQNTFTGDDSQFAYAGIDAYAISNTTIRDNIFTCTVFFGIHVISWNEFENGTCRNNTISQNNISGNTGIALSIEGDTDYSVLNGNTVNNNPGFIGIWICGCEEEAPFYGFCDYNVVKNNSSSYNDGSYYGFSAGFYSQEGGSNNTIGPNNTFNYNVYGMYFYATENSYNIFNNAALHNTACDVAYEMSDPQNLTNNQYECVTSF